MSRVSFVVVGVLFGLGVGILGICLKVSIEWEVKQELILILSLYHQQH